MHHVWLMATSWYSVTHHVWLLAAGWCVVALVTASLLGLLLQAGESPAARVLPIIARRHVPVIPIARAQGRHHALARHRARRRPRGVEGSITTQVPQRIQGGAA